jgi:hypothetical protein
VKGHYLKIWVANIKIIHSIIYRRFKWNDPNGYVLQIHVTSCC